MNKLTELFRSIFKPRPPRINPLRTVRTVFFHSLRNGCSLRFPDGTIYFKTEQGTLRRVVQNLNGTIRPESRAEKIARRKRRQETPQRAANREREFAREYQIAAQVPRNQGSRPPTLAVPPRAPLRRAV